MILDTEAFIKRERPFWRELEEMLDALDQQPGGGIRLDQLKRLHYLYQRTASDLARLRSFANAPSSRSYLEQLVARAYTEVHETRHRPHRIAPLQWFWRGFPNAFRLHGRAFSTACGAMLLGALFGAFALQLDDGAKETLIPPQFGHLYGDPSERVQREEAAPLDATVGDMSSFSAMLMTHNIRVSILAFALGIFWGFGTLVILFYNGILLGAVAYDYLLAGEGLFLLGWLLPHGAVEIPAILIAGQAGLVLGHALIGWGERIPMRRRLREVLPGLLYLLLGAALLLVWAGIVEAFFSQFHEPVLPYALKIAFGAAELCALVLFLRFAGRAAAPAARGAGEAAHA